MKNLRIFAVVLGVALSLAGVSASKSSPLFNQGYTNLHCFALQTVPDECSTENDGNQCSIEDEGDVWGVSGCAQAMKRP